MTVDCHIILHLYITHSIRTHYINNMTAYGEATKKEKLLFPLHVHFIAEAKVNILKRVT